MLHDLRYAFRALRRSPLFSITAVLSLALGIGAKTATFSLIDALLLKSLPVQNPSALRVVEPIHQRGDRQGFSYPLTSGCAMTMESLRACSRARERPPGNSRGYPLPGSRARSPLSRSLGSTSGFWGSLPQRAG